MTTTDQQVRKLMQEHSKTDNVEISSLRAGMSRKIGSKYIHSGNLPSESKVKHTWRTREDPFSRDWDLIREKLSLICCVTAFFVIQTGNGPLFVIVKV